jgi:hypothetical protein
MLRIGIGAALIFVYSMFCFSMGNKHGSNSRQIAKYNAEIAATNKRLQEFESDEKRRQIVEEDRAAAEDAAFATDLPKLDKCLLTASQAAALNKIGAE